MQRLYPMFPRGWPGLALALLRLAVSVHLVALTGGHGRSAVVGLMLLLLAALLLAGLFTPLAGTAAALAELAITSVEGAWTLPAALLLIDPMVLVLLGPGAYSCDARLFGRRLISLPD